MAIDQDDDRATIGVDGGGSSTKVAVVGVADCRVLAEATGPASNWNSVGDAASCKAILDTIRAALKLSGVALDRIVGVAAGISGLSTPADANKVEQWIGSLFVDRPARSVHIEAFNDVVAALASGTAGVLNGFACIAGTGSNCMAVDGVRQESAGGWGPLLGNSGSGHWMATTALRACCRFVDGRDPSTLLLSMIEERLGWPSGTFKDRIVDWMYKDGGREWAQIAALAPIVFDAAARDDAVAKEIVRIAAEELAHSVESVWRRMQWTNDGGPDRPLVLVGSLWKQKSLVDLFEQSLVRRGVRHRLIVPELTPAVGAALYSRRCLI